MIETVERKNLKNLRIHQSIFLLKLNDSKGGITNNLNLGLVKNNLVFGVALKN